MLYYDTDWYSEIHSIFPPTASTGGTAAVCSRARVCVNYPRLSDFNDVFTAFRRSMAGGTTSTTTTTCTVTNFEESCRGRSGKNPNTSLFFDRA